MCARACTRAPLNRLPAVPANWISQSDPCFWTGVTCINAAVVAIALGARHIASTLPSQLGALSQCARWPLG